MHPDVIKAALLWDATSPEGCARDVLLAQAKSEAIPYGAVNAAYSILKDVLDDAMMEDHCAQVLDTVRAALSAALLHMAKEGE